MKIMRSGDAVRRFVVGSACLGAAVLLGGCHRKQAPPTLPAVLQAPELPPPPPPPPLMELALPQILTVAPPIKVTEIRPRRPVRRPAPKGAVSEATPVDTAPDETPTPLGELSAGGDSTPRTQQDAAGLIASSERRLNGLSQTVARQQQAQVRKVRLFLKQAQQALGTGDAEGAKTLATKAKLLIDDMAK